MFIEMAKKLNEIRALERKKKEKMNKTDDNDNYSKDLPNEEKKLSQDVNAVPVIEEQFSIRCHRLIYSMSLGEHISKHI
jgi:hypothetical protein